MPKLLSPRDKFRRIFQKPDVLPRLGLELRADYSGCDRLPDGFCNLVEEYSLVYLPQRYL
ncbi:hypothetical protein GGD83_000109 [Rhodoblastus sphagnicola]|nr:hypothetical protein [Rhodoblastus sphagnicola]